MHAWEFFKKRELTGLSMPKKPKVSKKVGTGKNAQGSVAAKTRSTTSAPVDISDVRLDGEDGDKVPIFETCQEVRKKIAAHLRKPDVTAAQFTRDLIAQYHTTEKKSSSMQVQRFREKKEVMGGCTSSVFYAAYVFFEKIRVKQGKPKSKHRLGMEEKWPRGVDTEADPATQ